MKAPNTFTTIKDSTKKNDKNNTRCEEYEEGLSPPKEINQPV